MKMGDKEIEVLSEFMSIHRDDVPEFTFGTTGKAIIRQRCDLSHSGLSNHLKSLVKKQIITSTKKDSIIYPHLFPKSSSQAYMIKVILKEEN